MGFLRSKTKITEKKTERLILGFSQIGSESAWRTRNTQSIFEAAEANDIQIIFDDAQQKQENQIKAIRSFIVYQVDIIAFVPIVEDGWDEVLKEAHAAGIPVILVDRHITADKSLYAGFLGENALEEGRKASDFLMKICADKTKTINILEISGTENSSIAKERAQGFREGILRNENLKIIHSVNGDFLRSRGKEIAENLIQNARDSGNFKNDVLYFDGQKIDVIYSHNDSMTLGVLDSFANYGINPADTIIISVDAEQKSIDALVEGKLNCVVECNPNLGEMLMKLVKDVASGKKIPKVTYNEERIFTKFDDFSLYEPRGY
ncbi:ABC transporter substrate-binding protein [Treponema zioleckii]|uniref:ABC transporter substrate-binding protein n=1 Tax=Treponema zioleckii TaxID=331680 RepID=UPI001F5BA767|nr:ABC transporter substrate-binding protein [Treponema zioleckii]